MRNGVAQAFSTFGAKFPHDSIFIAPPITAVLDYVWGQLYTRPINAGRCFSHPDAETALQAALEASKVRAIGISNFDFDDDLFNSIVEPARIKPQMFQIQCHPYAQREHWQEMAKMASLNQEKRYFNMTYQQFKDWMENYEIWD